MLQKIFYNKLLLFIEFLITIPFMYYAYQNITVLKKGGIIMIPLCYALLVGIIIFIERGLYLKVIVSNMQKLLSKVDGLMKENKIDEIKKICENYPSPVSSIINTAIDYRDCDESKIKEMIEELGYFEIHKLHINLDYLALVAKISPLLGLLGTVTGLLTSFNQMLKTSGNISATVFAGGISEALLTTIFGLSIAIPALVIHQYLSSKISNIVHQMEKTASLIVINLKSKK
ncbi:MAG TPA: MotA/TolQ/ExbB proton channel family protein [bacterium]|nr:MotA/TolQ/ExbB proton channel family protein [bacterium]